MTEMWFTADTHFGHEAVLGHGNRPWASVEEMNEGLVEAWNAVVGPRDTVWHLGDVEFLSDLCVAGWLSRLNGRIHLLIGNHDSVKGLRRAVKRGVAESVDDVKYLRYCRRKLWLSHYPHRYWQGSARQDNPTYHLFGHCHGDLLVCGGRLMDVGVDAVATWLSRGGDAFGTGPRRDVTPADYRPINFTEVVEWLEGEGPTDHHALAMAMSWERELNEGPGR